MFSVFNFVSGVAEIFFLSPNFVPPQKILRLEIYHYGQFKDKNRILISHIYFVGTSCSELFNPQRCWLLLCCIVQMQNESETIEA